jgi:transcription antitermination factor NusG
MNIADINLDGRYEARVCAGDDLSWYAIRTRSNHEKTAAALLEARGFEQFLPFRRTRKLWSDRIMESSTPLFPGYVFCRFDGKCRTPILSTQGVVSIVAFAGRPAQIADAEIEAIRAALGSGQKTELYPYLREGQKIRVEKGPLRGLEGILIKRRDWRIVISVHLLRRSVAVEIDPDSVIQIERDGAPSECN